MRTLLKYPLEIAVSSILVALVAVTFSQVVFRYLLQAPLAWSEELARFLLMWLASLSAAYAFKTRSHFALRFVVDRFNPALQRAVGTLVTFLVVTFLVVFVYQSLRFTIEVRDMFAPATQMSLAVPYSSALVGSVLMLYFVIVNWWQDMHAATGE
jgi:TRAP-type C4-dicarboxylate transport system permease small subunit